VPKTTPASVSTATANFISKNTPLTNYLTCGQIIKTNNLTQDISPSPSASSMILK
jgi:hypothetical protein